MQRIGKLTYEEMRDKFDALVAPYLSEDQTDNLAESLLNIEQQNNVTTLFGMTRPEA